MFMVSLIAWLKPLRVKSSLLGREVQQPGDPSAMNNEDKTKQQLIAELEELQRQVAEREAVGLREALAHQHLVRVPLGHAGGRGDLIKHGINQGYEVVEQICGRVFEPVDEALLRERLGLTEGTVAQRIQELLPKAPLLAGASEAQIRELLFFSNFRRVAPGKIVFQQNDFSESLHMILDGTLEVLTRGDDGAERSVTKMAPGEYFGEMSLMSGRRRSGTVRVLEEAFLWEVGRKAMLKFIHMMPHAKHLVDRTFVVRAFQIYVFPHADYAVLSDIAERAEVLTYERGAEIVREGDQGDSFFFLRSGKVKVYQIRNGREVVVAYLSAGQYFGEMALLTGEPRMASVSPIDRVEVIRVSRADFLSCIEGSPALKKHFEAEANRRHLRTLEMHVRPELAEVGGFMVREELIVGDNVLLIDENRCIQCDQIHTAGRGFTANEIFRRAAYTNCVGYRCRDSRR